MSISTPTDIVLDVSRAAEPRRLQAATQRLAGVAAGGDRSDFAALVETPRSQTREPSRSIDFNGSTIRSASKSPRVTSDGSARPVETAYQALGGMLLQQAFETGMPSASSSLFGKGVAGSMWKSMLAQQMATSLSGEFSHFPDLA